MLTEEEDNMALNTSKANVTDYNSLASDKQNLLPEEDLINAPRKLSELQKKVLTCLILVCVMIGNTERTLFGPVYPSFATNIKNLTETQVGIVISSSSFATCFSCFAWSLALPILGARVTYAIGIIGSGLSSCLLATLVVVKDSTLFMVFSVLIRVVVGIFSAASYISELVIVAGLFPERTGTLMGMILGASYLGKMIGPLFGGALFEYMGFYVPFLIPAILLVVVGLSIVPIIPSSFKVAVEGRKGTCGRYCQMAQIPMFTVCSLLVGVHFGVTGMNISVLALRLNEFNLGPTDVGLVFFGYTATYFIASCVAGLIDGKLGNRKLGVAMVLVAFSLAGFFLTLQGPAKFYGIDHQPMWLLIFAFCMQSVFALGVVPAISIMFDSVKVLYMSDIESNSLVSGYLWGFATGGQAVGALLGAYLYDMVGWAWVTTGSGFLIWLLVLVLACVGCTVECRHKKGDFIEP